MRAEDDLDRVAQRHFRGSYQAFPVAATTIGVHSHDNTLGNYDQSTLSAQVAALLETQRQLANLDSRGMTLASRIDRDLLDSNIKLALSWHTQTKEWRNNPNFYAETPVYGVFLLVVREFAPADERARCVISRLEDVTGVLHAARANLETPPRVFTEVAIQTAEGGIDFFQNAVPQFASTVPVLEQSILDANQKALAAYGDFLTFLQQDLLPRSNGQFAAGRAHFEERLRLEHALDLSAPDLKRAGQRIFDDTERQMRELADTIDPRRNWSEIVEEAKSEHPSADRLLEAYVTEIQRLRSFVIAQGIVTVPRNEELEPTYTPQFARSTLPYAAYMPPAPFESRQKGQFWVTPIDLGASQVDQQAQLREHNYYAVPVIALHEAYPGHHVQLVQSDNVSSFIRRHVSSNIMCEGWALYCEDLIRQLGYRPAYVEASADSERAMKLFHLFILKDALWRAARVLIDVGLHTEGMTVEEAVQLFTDRVFLSKAAATAEVRRYTMSPTQPMSYAIGKRQIQSMREEFRRLSMHRFHDTFLSHGTIPIKFVREEMLGQPDVSLADGDIARKNVSLQRERLEDAGGQV